MALLQSWFCILYVCFKRAFAEVFEWALASHHVAQCRYFISRSHSGFLKRGPAAELWVFETGSAAELWVFETGSAAKLWAPTINSILDI